MSQLKVTSARRGKLIQPSGFKNYDVCLNTYVGCQFGCKYCYVRFFVKDKEYDWGQFVRVRDFVTDKLPKELPKYDGQRLVIGTMTDPYQPQERKSGVTRKALKAILRAGNLNKVGIFTRSPIILDDLDLIKELPRARVHFTITPYPRNILTKIEPIPIHTNARFDTVSKLKEAGIRVHVNVAPTLPVWSEPYIESWAKKLSEIGVDEFFVDPMQAYRESFMATFDACKDEEEWPQISRIVLDKQGYNDWKDKFGERWIEVWRKYDNGKTLAIWSDHVRHVWINMSTGKQMDHKEYGDDLK